MYRVTVGASFRLRCVVSGLISALLLTIVASEPAEAARWKKRSFFKRPAAAATYEPRYAAIVVDANTGDLLHDANADSTRHPASLTKIMTLYLLFERLEAGRLTLDSKMTASEHATEQAPTKLGLKIGQALAVEDAIKALVTKSANDAAVVVAEALAGSEEEFARLMTRKARALGMSRTVYKNASGLPDDDQVTTARDQALLAMAIQDRFPKYYRYFSTSAFAWKGVSFRNHNRLLGRVEGVDGIKTGYTRASGFNLVTSVKRGKRHLVAVVLGGRSGGARDARMRELIEAHVNEGAINRTAPRVVETQEVADRPAAKARVEARVASAEKTSVPVAASAAPAAPAKETAPQKQDTAKTETVTTAAIPPARPSPAPGSTDPIKPNMVKTLTVKASASQTASLAPVSLLSPMPVTSQTHAALGARSEPELPPSPPGARPGVLGVLSTQAVAAPAPVAPTPAPAAAAPVQKPVPVYASAAAPAPAVSAPPPAPAAVQAAVAPAAPAPAPVNISSESKHRSGWIVQVGAYDDIVEAREKIAAAKARVSSLLRSAEPFTEPVVKGARTLYRARFAGLKQDQAEAVCRELKRTDIACMTVRN
jgi:D-alanyl-D-alanine carboxypeptidase